MMVIFVTGHALVDVHQVTQLVIQQHRHLAQVSRVYNMQLLIFFIFRTVKYPLGLMHLNKASMSIKYATSFSVMATTPVIDKIGNLTF